MASDCAVTDTHPSWFGSGGTDHRGVAHIAPCVVESHKNLAAAHIALILATAKGGGKWDYPLLNSKRDGLWPPPSMEPSQRHLIWFLACGMDCGGCWHQRMAGLTGVFGPVHGC